MSILKVEMERLTVVSKKPFEEVVAALKAAVGQPDVAALMAAIGAAGSYAEAQKVVESGVGATGLMLFLELDLGEVIRKESGRATPKLKRLLIGNPLIMKEMAKHVPDAGSYAPVTVLVGERPDGVHLSYDRMASLLAPYGNREALSVARDLDAKIEALLHNSASLPL